VTHLDQDRRKIEPILAAVLRRNVGEAEFHQAVTKFSKASAAFIAKHPRYADNALIERICEPERQIIFRVPWLDDKGQIQIARGIPGSTTRARPLKGGIRFHPSVNSASSSSRLRADFQERAHRAADRRRQGRLDFKPARPSDREIMRFCQSS